MYNGSDLELLEHFAIDIDRLSKMLHLKQAQQMINSQYGPCVSYAFSQLENDLIPKRPNQEYVEDYKHLRGGRYTIEGEYAEMIANITYISQGYVVTRITDRNQQIYKGWDTALGHYAWKNEYYLQHKLRSFTIDPNTRSIVGDIIIRKSDFYKIKNNAIDATYTYHRLVYVDPQSRRILELRREHIKPMIDTANADYIYVDIDTLMATPNARQFDTV